MLNYMPVSDVQLPLLLETLYLRSVIKQPAARDLYFRTANDCFVPLFNIKGIRFFYFKVYKMPSLMQMQYAIYILSNKIHRLFFLHSMIQDLSIVTL